MNLPFEMRSATFISERAASGAHPFCIVCDHPLNGDPQVSTEGVRLFRCSECDTWSSHPRIDATLQATIHDSGDYFDHPYFKGRREMTKRIQVRCRELFERLGCAIDTHSLRGERLLDVGCDTGIFLKCAARQFGIIPVGLDVASRAVAASTSAGIETYQATLEAAPEHLTGFRAITAIDVVEHVVDPAGFLRAVRSRLGPGGVVYLETPNSRSAVYWLGRMIGSVTGGRPRGVFNRLFPPQHIQYFTVQSFERLARQAGLEVVRIGTRILPWTDISTSVPVRAAMSLIQTSDLLTGNEILIWAVLRRPVSARQESACN
jgi:SAM-dependent methyltransferase